MSSRMSVDTRSTSQQFSTKFINPASSNVSKEEEIVSSSVDDDESDVDDDTSSVSDNIPSDSSSDLSDDDDSQQQTAHSKAKFADRYDSSDEEDLRNTIGNIPVSWYNDESHIGYDLGGDKISRKSQQLGEIESFLARSEDPDYFRKVRDPQTGENVKLTDDQLETIANIQRGRFPEVGYNPYQPFVDFFTNEVMIHPVSDRPEHKRSFIPSKLDKLKVGRMVHAIKMGWIKPRKPKSDDTEEKTYYDLWSSETDQLSKSGEARMKMRIPAPKMALPDHSESYNPPAEYLLTAEEEQQWSELEPEERKRDFVPQKFGSLRQVPAYSSFVNDRFERCLDLYMAPRQRKMKLNVDPKDLLPELPRPQDLHPFPTTEGLVYKGHSGAVRCVAIEPVVGQFMVSGSDDRTIKIWEVASGRCLRTVALDGLAHSLAWCPNTKLCLLAAAVGDQVLLINPCVGDKLTISATDSTIDGICEMGTQQLDVNQGAVTWSLIEDEAKDAGCRLKLQFEKAVKQVTWHANGDYFSTVSPDGGVKSVVMHQLSKLKSQTPFSKSKGSVQCVLFDRSRPLFFVATQRHVRIYDLAKMQMTKKLYSNCRWISAMDLHPKGDNLIVCSYDCRLSWFDLELSAKPYKTLRHHKAAVRSVSFHSHYPLFASASDDGSVIVCHGRVYSDLLQNPLIVPVKVLRGHRVVEGLGVLACAFHPRQPWLVSAGADCTLRLYTY